MATIDKPIRPRELTIRLDDERDLELHRTLHRIADDRDQPVQDLVLGILREWVEARERQEDEADLAAIAEAAIAPTVSWKRVRASLIAAEDEATRLGE